MEKKYFEDLPRWLQWILAIIFIAVIFTLGWYSRHA